MKVCFFLQEFELLFNTLGSAKIVFAVDKGLREEDWEKLEETDESGK